MDNLILDIRNLHASIDGSIILQGLNLAIPYGEVHAIMGPNGAGKSTLSKILAGDSSYEVSGEIWFKNQNLLKMSVEERSHAGLFLSFQYPPEIQGVNNEIFLQLALNAQKIARKEEVLSNDAFVALLQEKMNRLQMPSEWKGRDLNVGFSGGEKKRNEILQMLLFEPDLCILDEADSGLDIDAMRLIATGVNEQRHLKRSMLLITHYQRLLEMIRPDRVHVLYQGKIALSGGFDLALMVEEKGYQWM